MNKDIILESIEQINSLVNSKFKETVKCDAKELFSTGGCYEFAKIIRFVYKDSDLYVKRDLSHCAIKIGDILYDCDGEIEDSNNYTKANDIHVYVFENYFNPYYKLFKISDTIIDMLTEKQYQM